MTRMARGNSSDSYTKVAVVVERKLPKSIVVVRESDSESVVVGRSLLSYVSEELVEAQDSFPVELELEIRSWLVKKEDLG